MKLSILIFTVLSAFLGTAAEFTHCSTMRLQGEGQLISWVDFETAIDQNKENKKPIFIDIYTSWCGWCKKMDNSTFKDPEVVRYMNSHYNAVKMDAESKDPIAFKEHLYEYKVYSGGKGYNELAVNLLGNKMSFPTFVILSKRQVKVANLSGFQQPKQLLTALEKYAKK